MTETLAPANGPTVKQQGGALLAHAAGYASHRTITVGLRSGLLEELGRAPAGATPDELAERLDLDPFYVSVWCRAALSAGVCARDGDRYRFAPTWPPCCSTRARRPMSAGSSSCSSSGR